jgi:ADP-heptose:LPS heptosyltransferase
MKIVDSFSPIKWQNMGWRKPKIGECIKGMNAKFKQVVLLIENESDCRQEAYILQEVK